MKTAALEEMLAMTLIWPAHITLFSFY